MHQYSFPTSLLLLATKHQPALHLDSSQTLPDTTHILDISSSTSTPYTLLHAQYQLYSTFSAYHTVICTLQDAHGTQSKLTLTPFNHSDFIVQVGTDNPETHPLLSKIPTTILYYNPNLDEDSQQEIPLYTSRCLNLQETHALLQQHIPDLPPDAINIWPHPLVLSYSIPWPEVDSRCHIDYKYSFYAPAQVMYSGTPVRLHFQHSTALHGKPSPVLYALRNSILFDHAYRLLQGTAALLYNPPYSDSDWTSQTLLTKVREKIPPHPSPCCTLLLRPQRLILTPEPIQLENPEDIPKRDTISIYTILPPENDPPSKKPLSIPQLLHTLQAELQTITQYALLC